VGGLVELVEGDAAVGRLDRPLPRPRPGQAQDQPVQRSGQLAAQALGLDELPFLEAGGVAQDEPGHELAPVQRDRLGERRHARVADPLRCVAVGPAGGQQLLEPAHVQLELAPVEPDAGTVGQEHAGAVVGQGPVQRRERAPQGGAGVLGVVLRPQQLGELVASVPLAGYRQVCQQGDGLARVDLHGRAAELRLRRPQQRQPEPGHSRPFHDGSSISPMIVTVLGVLAVTMPERWRATTVLERHCRARGGGALDKGAPDGRG
jgi:hypothetical protein